MKPLPEAVQRAFPREGDDLPERPWWRLDSIEDGVSAYRRVDGKGAYEPSPRHLKPLAGVDADYPLPHPGYRAGQVWAHRDGASIVVVQAETSGLYAGCGATWWMKLEFSRAYPFLMADPACPHLAPWSPCEEVKP